MISNFSKNCMGTISFDGKFNGMRKAQDFIVYPMKDETAYAKIQSDTRIGTINLATGVVMLSKPHSNGAYSVHMAEATQVCALSGELLLMLKSNIQSTAHGMAGNNGIVYCDNSAALEVFGAQS